MPASSVRDLNKAIASGRLDPVYLLHGEEEFLKSTKTANLIDAALDPAERDFNLDVRSGAALTRESLESLLATPPMLASRRVVVVRDVTALKKNARQLLDRYLEKPAPDLLLILVAEGELGKSDQSLAANSNAVEFRKLNRNDLEKWVEHYTTGTLGSSITPGAVRMLLSSAGDDLGQLASELDKLASYAAGDAIDETAVEETVGVRQGETLTELLDAIAQRDANRALALVGPVLSQPRTTAVSVLLALSAQTFGITYARELMDEGTPRSRVEAALFQLLKAGRGVTARPWGEAVRVWARAAEAWTAEDAHLAGDALLRADTRLKESRTSSDEDILISLILELCVSGATSGAGA